MFECLSDDRSEDDHYSNALDRATKSDFERSNERDPIDARNQGKEHDWHEKSKEDVPLKPRDRQKQDCDDGQ